MARTEEQLLEELARVQALYDEADAAHKNVRNLLTKADARRAREDQRRWGRVVENLESALDVTRSSLTAYGEQVKQLERQLKELRETGGIAPTEEALSEAAEYDIFMPKTLVAAEKILALPLTELSFLTLDEVSAMHEQLVVESEQLAAEPEPEPEAKKSSLDSRIERAREVRQNLSASQRRTGPSLLERRRQLALRESMRKIITGAIVNLTIEEVEAALEYHRWLTGRTDLSENDQRMKSVLDARLNLINERAAKLRKQDVQKYLR